jgi:DNA-binding MarR family transcriptional regulator
MIDMSRKKEKSDTMKRQTALATNTAQSSAPPEITRLVSYRISALSRGLVREAAAIYEAAIGVTVPEWRLISALGRFGELSVTEAAVETFMDRGQASRTIEALNRAGMLRMRADVKDGRRLLYSLSRDGETKYAAGMTVALRRQERLLEGFAGADVATFVRMLDRMMERLSASGAEEAADDTEAL